MSTAVLLCFTNILVYLKSLNVMYVLRQVSFCELLITSGLYLDVFIETDLDSEWFSILYLQSTHVSSWLCPNDNYLEQSSFAFDLTF